MSPFSFLPNTPKMPLLFVGHGSPMNAIENNAFSKNWKKIGKTLPVPSAIIMLSAHWTSHTFKITAQKFPETIYDMYGFPEELYTLKYPAPGFSELVKSITETLPEYELSQDWGYDHGTWSVLMHLFPSATIPVLQISINENVSLEEFGNTLSKLSFLREKGVLFIGSGNIVHNLRTLCWEEDFSYSWAKNFDAQIASAITAHDMEALIHYHSLGEAARLSVPTEEHFRPLLGIMALAKTEERKTFFNEGITLGSIGMRSVLIEAH